MNLRRNEKHLFFLLVGLFLLILLFNSPISYAGSPVSSSQTGTANTPAVAPGTQSFQDNPSNPASGSAWEGNFSPLSLPQNQDMSFEAMTAGRTFYVAKSGSDQSDGSETSPWKTIQRAVSQLQAGDTVIVSEGTYAESVQIRSSGVEDGWITIQGEGTVVLDGAGLGSGKSGFDTNGNDYLRVLNFTVNHFSASGIQADPGTNYLEVDGLNADGNGYAVRLETASNVTVRNAVAVNSNNAFRAYGASRDLLFENIETYNSRDNFSGMNPDYLNGDGFILESNVSNVTLRNVISANNWDAGFDIKASNVLIENALTYGNKNNFKTWGENIVIKSSLSTGAKRQFREDGTSVEGNGITVEDGSTFLINVTLADNEDHEIQIYSGGRLDLRDSIVARRNITGRLFESDGTFTDGGVLWYNTALSAPDFKISTAGFWADPGFVNWSGNDYHLKETSPALDFGDSGNLSGYDLDGNPRVVGTANDLGAYEIQTDVPAKFKGLANGDAVTGKIIVEPDPVFWPSVQNVTYYVDGRKITSTSSKPYRLGGSGGYDTSKLSKGVHKLTVEVQISKKEKVKYMIVFKVV